MKTLVWRDLLNQERVRGLLGGPASVKSEKEERTEFERDYGSNNILSTISPIKTEGASISIGT